MWLTIAFHITSVLFFVSFILFSSSVRVQSMLAICMDVFSVCYCWCYFLLSWNVLLAAFIFIVVGVVVHCFACLSILSGFRLYGCTQNYTHFHNTHELPLHMEPPIHKQNSARDSSYTFTKLMWLLTTHMVRISTQPNPFQSQRNTWTFIRVTITYLFSLFVLSMLFLSKANRFQLLDFKNNWFKPMRTTKATKISF